MFDIRRHCRCSLWLCALRLSYRFEMVINVMKSDFRSSKIVSTAHFVTKMNTKMTNGGH